MFIFVYIPMSRKTYPGLCFVSLYLKKRLSLYCIIVHCSCHAPKFLSREIFFVFQGIHYLNKRTLSRSNIIFTAPSSFSKSTCLVGPRSVFHKSNFVGFRWSHKLAKVWKIIWLTLKRTWAPFTLKPAGNTPYAIIPQVAVFFELMAKSATNSVFNSCDIDCLTGTSLIRGRGSWKKPL